ncbi:MAG TPA: hypothetical protein VGZ02_08945 [Candidatus Baltobacteraceae bacterium]|jgi:hypothetical protein|nr:hypothetical protein [Candidatus Baltobacteraceae bacterium]
MKLRLTLSAAVLCASFSGCASVTSDINFQAPGAGWTASPPILGRTQIWIKQGTSSTRNSIVVLVRGVNTSKNVFDNPGFAASKTHLDKDEATKICGNQPAEHYMGSGQMNGAPSVFEGYVSTVRGERYLALYAHPKAEPPDPQAETAIASLCPKSA